MKKLLLMLSLLLTVLTDYAQLKVNSDGRVLIGEQGTPSSFQLMIGPGNSYDDMDANILSVTSHGGSDCTTGVLSLVHPPQSLSSPSGRGVALFGSTTGYPLCLGVYGAISPYADAGVAVYGSIQGNLNLTTEKYAGYFGGETYVQGRLTATEFITPSDANLKENVLSLTYNQENDNTLENILKMNVVKYNYKYKAIDEKSFTPVDKKQRESELNAVKEMEEEVAQQIHYGLLAQELLDIYPEVVRKGQDGNLGINYVELVPILIRSIQELKLELEELKSITNPRHIIQTNTENTNMLDQNALYQTQSNVSSGKTVIRYRLSDNVKNASILIFDMSGRTLRNIPISPASDNYSFNNTELGNGIFLYSLIVNGKEVDTKRLIISK